MIVDDETLSCCSYNCWLRSEGGTVVEWSWRWTCNAVVPGSSLISSVTLGHARSRLTNSVASWQLGLLLLFSPFGKQKALWPSS